MSFVTLTGVSSDWQVSLSSDGATVTCGPGSAFEVGDFNPWNPGTYRQFRSDRSMQHGALTGAQYQGERRIPFTIHVLGDSVSEMLTNRHALAAAMRPTPGMATLSWQIGSQRYTCFGQFEEPTFSGQPRNSWLEAQCRFVATDPRIYSDENLTTIPAPVASGGAAWPLNWDVDWGVSGTSGIVIVNNAGSFNTPFRAQLVSGSTTLIGPLVENVTTGQFLHFPSLVLAPNEWLDIDGVDKTVLGNGTSSRYSALSPTSSWFDLVPGDNEIRLGALQSQTGAGLHVRWRSAWL